MVTVLTLTMSRVTGNVVVMTLPTLDVAREILADAAAKARGSGDEFAEIAASAIDVVLAALTSTPNEPTPATAHGTAIPDDALVDEMLPCPFCGSTRLSVAVVRPGALFPFVDCAGCGAQGPVRPGTEPARTKREAIAHWNRRAAERARWSPVAKAPVPPGERCLAAALRSLLEDLGLTPSGMGSEDLGILEVEIERLRASQPLGSSRPAVLPHPLPSQDIEFNDIRPPNPLPMGAEPKTIEEWGIALSSAKADKVPPAKKP